MMTSSHFRFGIIFLRRWWKRSRLITIDQCGSDPESNQTPEPYALHGPLESYVEAGIYDERHGIAANEHKQVGPFGVHFATGGQYCPHQHCKPRYDERGPEHRARNTGASQDSHMHIMWIS